MTEDIVLRPRRKELGRLRSYNQFPLHYENIAAMTADLLRIKRLGFTSVWVNPLFEPCQSMDWVMKELGGVGSESTVHSIGESRTHSKPGSPYATRSFNINAKLSSHTSEEFDASKRKELDYADILNYTDTARAQGLTPIYDFVMRHVAVDNPLVQEKPHWFKRHPNGKFVFFGRDENYHTTSQSWDDVLEFNYDDPTVRHEIVNEYLKPMADIVIGKLGFEGLRIDTAGEISHEAYAEIIPYMDHLCKEKHGKPLIVIGETLGQNSRAFLSCKGFMDYVYNSIYFQPFNKEAWQQDDTWFSHTKGVLQHVVAPTIGFAGNHDVLRLADFYGNNQHVRDDLLRKVIIACCLNGETPITKVLNIFTSLGDRQAFSREQLRALVRTGQQAGIISDEEAGRVSSDIEEKGNITQQHIRRWFNAHPPADDRAGETLFRALIGIMFEVVQQEKQREIHEMREYGERRTPKLVSEYDFIRLIPGRLDKRRLNRLIREAFCFTAFASDGGWFLTLGDEWGVSKHTNVFTASPQDLEVRAYPDMDFSPFIRSINKTVAALPHPSLPEWVQRCYLDNPEEDKALASFLIHQGNGYEGTSHLVIANVSEEKRTVDYDTFMKIKEANGRNNCPEKNGMPSSVYLCGNLELSPHLRMALESKSVKIFESDKEPEQPDPSSGPHLAQNALARR